ncbi:MAG: glycosyltransferase family 4 protein [Calothrix sp. MO_167.B12]|nr:glycosyltransferase family 4 protein [Calothrix sp. MO_167.B12]
MDKLRILLISNLYPPQVVGGYERGMADCARLLNDSGHDVLIVTSNTEDYTSNCHQPDNEPEIHRCLYLCGVWNNQGTAWLPLEQVAMRTFQNRVILAQELQEFKPDICLVGNIDFLGVELLDKILADGIPVAHYVMNSAPGYPVELMPKSKLHQYITCSDWIRDGLKQQGYLTDTAQTVYPGAAVEEFYQVELPPRDKLRIAYASLVMPYKGADVLIEALSLLHHEDLDFSATIAGGTLSQEFVEELQRFVESEGMEDKVKFPGVLSRQQLKELYKTHNVLVFPSRFQEPFGISQIEAMAAGLTLVTSGTGGAGEIVEHHIDGFKFESENPLDLADVLSYLPTNTNEWEKITVAGQKRAMSNFSQARGIEQLEDVLFKLGKMK